jgi:hypothetical protein
MVVARNAVLTIRISRSPALRKFIEIWFCYSITYT